MEKNGSHHTETTSEQGKKPGDLPFYMFQFDNEYMDWLIRRDAELTAIAMWSMFVLLCACMLLRPSSYARSLT